MTIQQKTAFIFTGITAIILVLVSCVAYFFMNMFAFQDYYKRLEIRGIILAKAQLANHQSTIREAYIDIREQHLEPLPGEREYFFPVDSLQVFRKTEAAAMLPATFFNNITAGRPANVRFGQMFYTGILYRDGGRPYVSIAGAQNADSIRYARNLQWILTTCVLLGIIIAYTLGIFFSRHTFKPIREIINKVKIIGVENLHLRLDAQVGEDEIAEITLTFNDMLARLETAFETQNNFVSNASHELRSPLTTMYGEAEIALSRERTGEQYRESLRIILNQAEKLQHLTDSLLNLAQTGFDGKKQNFKLIRLDELLLEAKGTLNKIVPGNKLQIHLAYFPANEHELLVKGNYQLLKLGLSNVMENACKYSNNDVVDVTLDKMDDKLCVIVHDRGIGIPSSELKHIYDPFFRASNTGKYQGYGIGLPLTRNIFRLHRGNINVQSGEGKGTKVILSLPPAS